MKIKVYDVKQGEKLEKAILVAVEPQGQTNLQTKDYLAELTFLVKTAGAKVLKTFTQKLSIHNPKTYIGTGRLKDVADYAKEHEIELAVFDDELTPSQIRNIEKVMACRIIDRSTLILDIFAKNAKSNRAKTQVELAQSQYMLPRLTRLWTHLEKQRGGIGMRGPGEKEIETDRRIIRDKITLLKSKLDHISRQSKTQRNSRKNSYRIALVGYTNVGKSTIMNTLTKAEILAENMLFATLDSTVRKLVLTGPENLNEYVPPKICLLSDTVGFIRKLPHQLVESFKSTLDEIVESDMLLHVVDISHPNFEEQMNVVKNTLAEIGAADKLIITIFNKTDLYKPEATSDDIFEDEAIYNIEDFKKTWMSSQNTPSFFMSAMDNDDVNRLRDYLFDII